MIPKSTLKKWIPKRDKSSNKTDGGKVLIAGGATGLSGAGILSALAATRSGAGYTYLLTDLAKFPWLKFPDFIVRPLKLKELKDKESFSTGIGPGLGTNKSKARLINYLRNKNFQKVVLDADALTLIAQSSMQSLPASWILTPHEGELARMLGVSSAQIKKNRRKSLLQAYEKYNCTILLKGSTSLIISPYSSKIHAIKTQAHCLAKAGTGDVLLGMVTAFRAQGLDPFKATYLAVLLHGKTAESWEKDNNDQLSLRPLDLIDRLPGTLKKYR